MVDVLIAGGGPAGLATAIALAERRFSVAVVDMVGGISPQRGELLPHGAFQILQRLGLGDVSGFGLEIDDVISNWGGSAQSHGGQPSLGLHGWGIDRQALSYAMVDRVRNLHVPILKTRIVNSRKTADGWRVSLTGCEPLNARTLIDATGRRAAIARRHGATVLQGTNLVAVTWQASSSDPAAMIAEATADGWWYSVPHPSGRTIGFMTEAHKAKRISTASTEFLSQAKNDLELLSIADVCSAPHLMDSRSAVLDRFTGPGWLATGDSAAAFDPIASQGLFNALSAGFFAGNAAADVLSGDAEAALVYEALAARTAERTHGTTHLQYAALPYDTPFWQLRRNPRGAAPSGPKLHPAFSKADQARDVGETHAGHV